MEKFLGKGRKYEILPNFALVDVKYSNRRFSKIVTTFLINASEKDFENFAFRKDNKLRPEYLPLCYLNNLYKTNNE